MAAGILIVDDYPPNLVAMEAALEPLGEPIIKAGSGKEALRYLADHDCDLIMLDVQMPELDGFRTAATIRAEERTRHLPIIFVTASHRDDANAVRGYAQGAVDYVVKPVDPDLLRAKVGSQLDLHRRREARNRSTAAATAEAERRSMYAFFMHAPGTISITRGPNHIFELVNDRFQELLGDRQVLGKPAREALPELSAHAIWAVVDEVFRTGEPFAAAEFAAHLDARGDNSVEPRFFSVLIQPTRDFTGAIDGLMIHGFEVTNEVRARVKEREAVKSSGVYLFALSAIPHQERIVSLKDPNVVNPKKRKRVAIVLANPAVSTTTQWPSAATSCAARTATNPARTRASGEMKHLMRMIATAT